jgi:hypothetical protein
MDQRGSRALRTTPFPGPDTTQQSKTPGQAGTEPAGPSACVIGPTSLDQAHGPDGPCGPQPWTKGAPLVQLAGPGRWTNAAWSRALDQRCVVQRVDQVGLVHGNSGPRAWTRHWLVQARGPAGGPGPCGRGAATWSRNSWTRPRATVVQERLSVSLASRTRLAGRPLRPARPAPGLRLRGLATRSALPLGPGSWSHCGLARNDALIHGGHAGTVRLRRVTITT